MKSYRAKIVVKFKTPAFDTKGEALKNAVESLYYVENLNCSSEIKYVLTFDSNNQVSALNLVQEIAEKILISPETEFYEIKSLTEI